MPSDNVSTDNVQALPAGTLLGDFRLDAVIGHGGFGITYRAFDTQLAKIVAIKEYLPVEYAVRDANGIPQTGENVYVRDGFGHKIVHPARLEAVEKRLKAALEAPVPAKA